MLNGNPWNEATFNDPGLVSDARPAIPVIARKFHDWLTESLYPNTIERERRVLLGIDSSLELYTQRGMTSELRFAMHRDFSVFSVYGVAGPEEWICNLPDFAVEPWEVIREITELRLHTHGQNLVFKVLALERPVESHCYRMRLQATNDPRF